MARDRPQPGGERPPAMARRERYLTVEGVLAYRAAYLRAHSAARAAKEVER